MLHGLETWAMTDQMGLSFKKLERKILENIYVLRNV